MSDAEGRRLALTVQLGPGPAEILAGVTEHQVPPGQDGGDPALAPTLQADELFAPTGTDLTPALGPGASFPVTLEESP